DEAVAAHQASIVRRQGRFAIYAPEASTVLVDGNEIPPERWVWLPQNASIQLGARTLMRLEWDFDTLPVAAAAETTPAPGPSRARSAGSARRTDSERTRRKTRNGEHRRQVARFISNRVGEPLVRLGEDGQL